jgi:hypothetical protein
MDTKQEWGANGCLKGPVAQPVQQAQGALDFDQHQGDLGGPQYTLESHCLKVRPKIRIKQALFEFLGCGGPAIIVVAK